MVVKILYSKFDRFQAVKLREQILLFLQKV